MEATIEPKDVEKLNARAEELGRHFMEFWKECQAEHPEMTDRAKVFEGWAMQRIAGLEHLVLDLGARVIALEGTRRYRDPAS